jgi:transposase-like protein
MAVTIAGRQFWLWRAVDDEGEVLDLLVQPTARQGWSAAGAQSTAKEKASPLATSHA